MGVELFVLVIPPDGRFSGGVAVGFCLAAAAAAAGGFSTLRLFWLLRNGLCDSAGAATGGGGCGGCGGGGIDAAGRDGTNDVADEFGGGGCAAGDSGIISGSTGIDTTCCFLARPISFPEAEADPLFRFSAAYTSSSMLAITSSIADLSKVT